MQSTEDRRTFTEAARRAQIVEGAITTINEIGYHRASLAEIAKRAQVAKSGIVYYFGSKDALLLHVLDIVFSGLGNEVENAVAAESAPEDQLRTYAQSYLSHVDAHRREVAAGVTIVVSHRGPEGVPLYLIRTQEETALLRQILSDGMAEGTFRRMPLAVAVDVAESLLDLAVTTVQRDLDTDLSELIPGIITFLFRGLDPQGQQDLG